MWTPEVDNPEKKNCIQDNPKQPKVKSKLIEVENFHTPFACGKNPLSRLDFSRKQWVTNWDWRNPRTIPRKKENEKWEMELRSPGGTEPETAVFEVGLAGAAHRRAAAVERVVIVAAARQNITASRGSYGVGQAS